MLHCQWYYCLQLRSKIIYHTKLFLLLLLLALLFSLLSAAAAPPSCMRLLPLEATRSVSSGFISPCCIGPLVSCSWSLPFVSLILVWCTSAGVGDCQNDSMVGWFDGSGVSLHCCWSGSDFACSVSSTSFIAAARSVHSSKTASASVLDTSLSTFLKNASCFSNKFVSVFAKLLLISNLGLSICLRDVGHIPTHTFAHCGRVAAMSRIISIQPSIFG